MSSDLQHRRRWAATAVAAFAVLVLLTACNPIQKRLVPNGDVNALNVTYHGPPGAWLEASVTGGSGFDVRFEAVMFLDNFGERACRDAATGAVEPCENLQENVLVSDWYPVDNAGFRSTISPHDADQTVFNFECRQGGPPVTCPDSLRVTIHAVDDNGDLVGDLT